MHRLLATIAGILLVVSCANKSSVFDEDTPGLHVFSNYGEAHRLVARDPSEADIIETMMGLDWHGFHQVVLVLKNGESLEVGGSLNPDDGLSSMYRSGKEDAVIEGFPPSVEEMSFILMSFYRGDGYWKAEYIYE